jgi:HipA-like C-terminal domain
VTEFSIRHVDSSQAQSVEMLGSKPKFWLRENDRRLLFKGEDRGTGEDWAEVVACSLSALLGLPHVAYELAAEHVGERYIRPGVVCENMAPSPLTLVLGNELLLAIDPKYPMQQRFKVRQHSIEAVSEVASHLDPPDEVWSVHVPNDVKSALDVFVGYVMFDAWIANQDRHHENWGAIWDGKNLRLAPTFDHGAAMARNLRDSERQERLTTRDRNRTVAAFANRGRSAFYGSRVDERPLALGEAFRSFSERVPIAAQAWLARLREVNRDAVWGILQNVPSKRMSDTCKRFTMELLSANHQRLLE